ncbi:MULTISPECIES: ACT domain-containing protein [Ferroplasma]|jgi:hypothetical protein|uniref:ACT domain-containing protein n=2 Tax=Ferroplasma TaxID=74968 RepID=S0AQX8_FERAC|nr:MULTISPECIES: ACT domain-containing protein [Ferroplasma]MCL4348618.1 ACT domain-containing protein [Candidatus Thermoplasmatota archaeon]AGO61336.1 hypothetical protein FACI_IFERC00001G1356 [Ferroplasma acidarmanus Fer1]ARD84289.1 hypothetical protein FAD_0368 [Ferroplasma acidiphilum]NOL59898.1 ACT domain-containing protein [Ferroplasma acidiphilum]WMT53194.1 MAG: ACT domain-containing protein [Ferroplasma acidiphilum]
MVNTAEIVRKYIDGNPDLKDYLNRGIINISALSREIMANTGIEDFDATMAALKRYRSNGQAVYNSEILDRSNLEMSSNISLIVIKKSYESLKIITGIIGNLKKLNSINLVETKNSFSLIGDNETIKGFSNFFSDEQIIEHKKDLGQLSIISPEEIEKTKGYINFITMLLYRAGINILQIISFYSDTIIILEEKDLTDAFKIISAKMIER